MTASYDGRFILRDKEKRLEPCCENMATLIAISSVRIMSLNKKNVVKTSFSGGDFKLLMATNVCPFCGARLEVV